jgi:hypothetical protein
MSKRSLGKYRKVDWIVDLIYAARYTEVCDYSWGDWSHPRTIPGGIWYVDTASIRDFFNTISLPVNRHQQFVVVSPSCDFGVCLQQENHPIFDLEKWVGLNANFNMGYSGIQGMPPRINPDSSQCCEFDKYSIKCWSYTTATFNKIPDNVKHWFVANCDIIDDRVTAIPFGIYGNKDKLESANAIFEYNKEIKRDKGLYVNFQFYTTDRFRLYRHFMENFNGMVTCEREKTFDHFLDQLASHKFVLCPPGNGLDCYRTLEAIYMGAIPVLQNRLGCIAPYLTLKYPMLFYPNLFMLDPYRLDEMYDNMMENWEGNIDLTTVKWPYWEKRIRDSWEA